jgi:hypothetical protein
LSQHHWHGGLRFNINDKDSGDQYARLYTAPVVDAINLMHLPRYGLGNYVAPKPHKPPTPNEAKQLDDLSRAGKRLVGFCGIMAQTPQDMNPRRA